MKNDKKKYKFGFKMFDFYFEELDDKLFFIIFEEKFLKEIGYKVFVDYFKIFEEKIFLKMFKEKEIKVVIIFS